MRGRLQIPKKLTAGLVYGRPPLVFAGMLCGIAVMLTRDPVVYTLGVVFFFISMSFDLVDGWFEARFRPNAKLAYLADRIMDKVVYSIIFPLVAAGMMWRLHFVSPEKAPAELQHAIFVLLLCVTVLIRDNFASFMRGFAIRKGQEPESSEFSRIRTTVAAPVGALLYAYAFYVPEGPPSWIYFWISWLGNLPLHILFLIEIIFMIINFGSIALYCRKYGSYCLDDLCLGDEQLRRKILAFFPNALTIMNAMMGILAVFFAFHGHISEAFLVLIGAAFFDKLDGAWARRLGLVEARVEELEEPLRRFNLGGILDDISDAVSFCVAPPLIYYLALSNYPSLWIEALPVAIIAFSYGALGVLRLVYFTLDKNPIPGFFKGMPTPAAALLVVAPLIMFDQAASSGSGLVQFWSFFSSLLMVLAGIAMNLYPIHYIHLGRFMGRHPWFARMTVVLGLLFVFTPLFGYIGLIYLLLYLFSPLLSWHIEPEQARETGSEAGIGP